MARLSDTEFLEKCNVISETDSVEGIILSLNHEEFIIEVNRFEVNENDVYDGTLIDEISISDILPLNKKTLIGNFRTEINQILGHKKYYIEESLYNFLTGEIPEDFDDDFIDNSEERSIAEQIEEEKAEENFDRFMKHLEDGD